MTKLEASTFMKAILVLMKPGRRRIDSGAERAGSSYNKNGGSECGHVPADSWRRIGSVGLRDNSFWRDACSDVPKARVSIVITVVRLAVLYYAYMFSQIPDCCDATHNVI